MSDFLRNLRSSRKKDTSIPRRNIDGNYYQQQDRRRTHDRRSTHSEGLEILWSCLNDILPKLVENTTQLTRHLQSKTKEDPMLIEAKIRQYNAVAVFFDNLNRFFNENKQTYAKGKSPRATASYTSGTHYTKDDILSIIKNMRKDGATFSIIADYLKDKGIPTFSGRGEWHAQTIHRLCK